MEVKSESNEKDTAPAGKDQLSRRSFLKIVGVFTIGAGSAGLISCDLENLPEPSPGASLGYILVDSRKCQGCLTCMMACSLVNEGCVSLSLSRIQVATNAFATYPDDVRSTQCRQCEDPKCVEACPNDALVIDKDHGNIRLVNPNHCIGCGRCVMACPFEPKRPVLGPDPRYGDQIKSRKCDLCLNAPHHFSENGGGIEGIRACEAMCPVGAILFTNIMPEQTGDEGYEINLRNNKWRQLGYDTKL